MFNKVDDFISVFEEEGKLTLKILNNLTDETLQQEISGYRRSIGRLAWHITLAPYGMVQTIGIDIGMPDENAVPNSVGKIIEMYEKTIDLVKQEVPKKITDDDLDNEIDAFGQKWKVQDLLISVIVHQIHHRGQLTVLMRLAGLEVPGIYGPSYEEWSRFGREPLP